MSTDDFLEFSEEMSYDFFLKKKPNISKSERFKIK